MKNIKQIQGWQPIETAPRDGTHILIRYYKTNRSYATKVFNEYIVTEAYYTPRCYSDWDIDKKYPKGNDWHDALDRLIVSWDSKVIKAFIEHWMPLPNPPKED